MVWLSPVSVPVIVRGYVPVGMFCMVVTVIVDDPDVTGFGLNEIVMPEGFPVTVNFGVPV